MVPEYPERKGLINECGYLNIFDPILKYIYHGGQGERERWDFPSGIW